MKFPYKHKPMPNNPADHSARLPIQSIILSINIRYAPTLHRTWGQAPFFFARPVGQTPFSLDADIILKGEVYAKMQTSLCKIRCSCGEILKEKDVIVIDVVNTLAHKECYKASKNSIKGVGTFKEIAEKFPFFYEDELLK
jgi:hypothetical protein